MKVSAFLVVAALVATSAAAEDSEERNRVRAEKMAAISSQMSRHLRTRGTHGDHAQTPPAKMKSHARKDEVSLKGRETSKKAVHAENVRRIADQLSKHVARPTAHELRPAHVAQQSFAKGDESRKPSAAAAKKVEHKQSMQKLAKKMARNVDPTSVRSEVAKGGRGSMKMKAARDAQITGQSSTHAAAPMPKKVKDSNLKNVQQRFAQATHQRMKAKEAENGNANPAEEGQGQGDE